LRERVPAIPHLGDETAEHVRHSGKSVAVGGHGCSVVVTADGVQLVDEDAAYSTAS
jgi:hypothetical protein